MLIVGKAVGRAGRGKGMYGNCLCLPLNFAVNPKLL